MISNDLGPNPMAKQKVKKPPRSIIGRTCYTINSGELQEFVILEKAYDKVTVIPAINLDPSQQALTRTLRSHSYRLTKLGAVEKAIKRYEMKCRAWYFDCTTLLKWEAYLQKTKALKVELLEERKNKRGKKDE